MASRGDTKGSGLWGAERKERWTPHEHRVLCPQLCWDLSGHACAGVGVWAHACVGVGVWVRGHARVRIGASAGFILETAS